MSAYDVLFESLLRPFQLMLEPAVLYINIYLALAYAIFYREHRRLLRFPALGLTKILV